MRSKILLAAAILALALQGTAGAAIYRWVDENGVISFRDTPPPENPEKAEIIEVAPLPSNGTPPAGAGGAAAVDRPGRAAPKVELYVTSWCPYCKKAEAFFRSQGIPFTVYDVEKDSRAARRKNELDSRNGVPFAVINGQKIHGYSEAAYRQALGSQR